MNKWSGICNLHIYNNYRDTKLIKQTKALPHCYLQTCCSGLASVCKYPISSFILHSLSNYLYFLKEHLQFDFIQEACVSTIYTLLTETLL